MSDGLDVRGGAGGIGARTDDMRLTAQRLAATNGTLEQIAGHARGAAMSGALASTTIFSPLSAAQAEGRLLQAAASVSVLTLRLEGAVLVLRTRARLFELADSGEHALRLGLSVALFLRPEEWARDLLSGRNPLTVHPEVVDVVTGGLARVVIALGQGRPGMPRTYEEVLALLQGLAGISGRWHAGPIAVDTAEKATRTSLPTLESVLASVQQLATGPADPDDRSAVRVVRVSHGDGPPTWIVEIPGTDFAGGAHDPSDGGANLSLMRGHDELMNAVLQAMRDSHVGAGERVLLTGHSQGGIAAMAVACDPEAQHRYNITHVLTAGSPVGHFHPPPGVHVLSIEHHQDPVPRLEGDRNPDRPDWTTIGRDVGDQPGVDVNPFAAHHGALYAQTAGLIDHDPRLAGVRADFGQFLGDDAEQRDSILTRR